MPQTPPVVLTIAGFDPSSGAGITADIKTIAAHGCYGIAAITASTVQTTAGVRRVVPAESDLLIQTLQELAGDFQVSAVHIGMLGTGQIAASVAEFLEAAKLPNIVLDTVLSSTSGISLLDEAGIRVLREKLLPLATVVTPNIAEAAVLTGLEISEVEEMKQAAMLDFGAAGKGYLVDIVGQVLENHGIKNYVIDAGGDEPGHRRGCDRSCR